MSNDPDIDESPPDFEDLIEDDAEMHEHPWEAPWEEELEPQEDHQQQQQVSNEVTQNLEGIDSSASLTYTVKIPKVNTKVLNDEDLYSFERFNGHAEWRRSLKEIQEDEERNNTRSKFLHNLQKYKQTTTSKKEVASHALLVRFQHSTYHQGKRFVYKTNSPAFGARTIPVTLTNGTRVQIPMRSSYQMQSDTTTNSSSQLLQLPLCEIVKRADRILFKSQTRIDAESQPSQSTPVRSRRHKVFYGEQLWVDKYAPNSFLDLLSDERTNRLVLKALKGWDPFVFGTPCKQSECKNTQDNRPDLANRVILLCGPPGVGKTTLAHIAAKHAGYRPVEINASDDRSAQVLRDKLKQAMESNTLDFTNSHGRPNCIIMDEVDGADSKQALKTLVDIIKAEMPPRQAKRRPTILKRPIIFIANHKYAPALRPLLDCAQVLDVQPPLTQRLVQRIKSVLAAEKATCQNFALLIELVNGSGGDIRSCLHTLQIVAAAAKENGNRRGEVLDISSQLALALSGADCGRLKDSRGDVATTLNTVFRKRPRTQVMKSTFSDTEIVSDVVTNFGDCLKTLDYLFNNVPFISYIDPTLDRCATAHEWLSAADMLRSSCPSTQAMLQSMHVPSTAMTIHLLCRIETRPELQLSNKKMFNAKFKMEAHHSLMRRFRSISKLGLSTEVLTREFLSYILWTLSCGAGKHSLSRTVTSTDMLTRDEKLAFASHLARLRSMGLTYVPDSTSISTISGTRRMRLDPEIDSLVIYKDLVATRRNPIPDLLKVLLAHSAAMEAMRERETVPAKTITVSTKPAPIIEEPKSKMEDRKTKFNNFLGRHATHAKAARKARSAARVGIEKGPKKQKLAHSGSGALLENVLRYKYQKGFTQAVRVPLKIEDLL